MSCSAASKAASEAAAASGASRSAAASGSESSAGAGAGDGKRSEVMEERRWSKPERMRIMSSAAFLTSFSPNLTFNLTADSWNDTEGIGVKF